MVDCELCSECKRQNFARVLHFQTEILKDDYIKLCKIGTCVQYKNKTWMTHFLFKEFFFFFKRFIPKGIFRTIFTY